MENNNFNEFQVAPGIIIPAKNELPAVEIVHGRLKMQVTSFLQALRTCLAMLNDQIVWGNETYAMLQSLAANILTINNLLEGEETADSLIVKNPNVRFLEYNEYFHIKEASGLSLIDVIKEDAHLTYSILLEVSDVRLDDGEVCHLLQAMDVRWSLYGSKISHEGSPISTDTKVAIDMSLNCPISKDCRITAAFFRWYICHYDFALNIIHATYHFEQACHYLDSGDNDLVAASIINASTLLRGSTTSMVIGALMPPKIYQEYIRPSMGLGFTGNDNPQWAGFKTAKAKLVAKLKMQDNPKVIRAAKQFLEYYLEDIEVHTTIAAKLIGNKTSLTVDQSNAYCESDSANDRPAVADLRNLHYMRLKEFEFLNQYPIVNQLFK